jgi:hypothetical protein
LAAAQGADWEGGQLKTCQLQHLTTNLGHLQQQQQQQQ